MKEVMYDIHAGLLAALVLAAVLVAVELGFRFGRRKTRGAASDDEKAHVNATQASTLGILALVLAFTFSLSLQRFDIRSDAVVDEANAIGTAYLRAQLLPPQFRAEVRTLLRQYVDLRVEAGAVSVIEEGRWGELMASATRTQDALWDLARRAAEAEPNPVTSGLFIQSLNELIDSFGRRDAALNRHVPEVVLFVLLGTFLITGAMVGFAAGIIGRRPSSVSFAMVALIVVLVFVIFDLDRPRRGLIVVSEKNLIDLQASMKAPATSGAPPRPASGPDGGPRR